MALLMTIVAWVSAHLVQILGAVVALDTLLAEIPAVEANSTFQLIKNGALALLQKVSGAKPPQAS